MQPSNITLTVIYMQLLDIKYTFVSYTTFIPNVISADYIQQSMKPAHPAVYHLLFIIKLPIITITRTGPILTSALKPLITTILLALVLFVLSIIFF